MNKLLITTIIAAFSTLCYGQISTLSPYSIYGLGEDISSSLTAQASMAHTGIAVRNPLNINATNPAALSQLGRVTFNMDVRNEFLTLNTSTASQSNSIFTINNISFGFPLINDFTKKRRSTIAFGLKPLTGQGYDIEITQTVPDLSDVTYRFIGNGGVSDAFASFSYDLLSFKRENKEKTYSINRADVLSLGITGSYLFGTLDRSRITEMNLGASASNLYRGRTLEISDISMRTGLMYSHALTKSDTTLDRFSKEPKIGKKVIGYFSVGAFYNPSVGLNAFQTDLDYSYAGAYTNPGIIDTLTFNQVKTTTQAVSSYGIGASLSLNDKWTFALDATRTEWSKLTINGLNQGLNDATRISFGTEFIPAYDESGKGSLLKTIRYRGGLSMQQTRLNVNNTQPMRYGINFGIGVPLVATRSTSMFNLGLEFANRGNANIGLTENYVNLHVGFTFTPNMSYDFWFLKRKYD